MTPFRRALLSDLDRLVALEEASFAPSHQEPRSVLRRAVKSSAQEVWIRETGDAALFLRHYPRSLRIVSIAVHPEAQGRSYGRALLDLTFDRAKDLGRAQVILEAETSNPSLVAWYERHGFVRLRRLPDYYGAGDHAWKMARWLVPAGENDSTAL